MPTQRTKQLSVLTMNTVAFAVNFAVWTMFSVIGIKIKGELGLSETEFGLLVATPILTGSLTRLPLGLLTDRFGGRIVFFVQMLLVAIPTYGLSFATEYWQYLVIGLFVGLAGGSFAIGIALHVRLVPERAPRHGHGHLRCRERRRGRNQSGRATHHRGRRLACSAGDLFHRHADHGRPVLVHHLSRPAPRRAQEIQDPRFACEAIGAAHGGPGLAFRPGLLFRLRRLRRPGPVVAQVLRGRVRAQPERGRLHHHVLYPALRADSRPGWLDVGQVGREHGDLVGVLGESSSACSWSPTPPRP